MTEPTTKQELLDAIESTHQDMIRLLASMSDDEKTAPILDEGWSVKDSLCHLVDWEKMAMDWMKRSLAGEQVKRFVTGFQYDSEAERVPVMEALNTHLYKQNKERPLDDVMRDFRATHRAIYDFIAPLEEKDLFDPDRFTWRNGSPAVDMLGGNTHEHYAEHREWILEQRTRRQGQPVTRSELLRRIDASYNAMEKLLASLSYEQMNAPGLDAGWSVKDSLAHISGWQLLMVDWVTKYRNGQEVKRIAEGFLVGENDAEEQMHKYNAFLFDKNQDRALPDVLNEFRAVYARMTAQIESMSEDEIFNPTHFAARKGSPLINLIVGDSYEHYDEHAGWIREWLAKAG